MIGVRDAYLTFAGLVAVSMCKASQNQRFLRDDVTMAQPTRRWRFVVRAGGIRVFHITKRSQTLVP
jgi:hypothetical protein